MNSEHWQGAGTVAGEVAGSAPRRLPGLDGLRAVAVAAVVLFHLDSRLLPGGFLGVDIFFVISGYLITRLLLTEVANTGRLRLGRFYLRRARRLLPAVVTLLVVVTLAGTLIWRDQLPTLRGSVLSSLGYFTNWWLIFDHQSYFVAAGRPPMLQHLWSLAIEEQYYLIWAPMLIVLTGVGVARARRAPVAQARRVPVAQARRVPVARVVAVALLLAAASTVAMAVLAIRDGVPYRTDSSRVYFGTDTHTMGLLLGAAAGAWAVRPRGERRHPVPPWLADLVALGGLAALVWFLLDLDEFRPLLYRGGFTLVDVAALAAVCAVVQPAGHVGRWLDTQPMRWLGERSYGIYLWHWPVVVVTRPGLDVHGPLWLIDPARAGLALALAAASYRYVEQPLRYYSRGAAARVAAAATRASRMRRLQPVAGLAGVVAACTVALVAIRPAASPLASPPPDLTPSVAPTPAAPGSATPTGSTGPAVQPAGVGPTAGRATGPPAAGGTGQATAGQAPPTSRTPTSHAPAPLRVSAFGDSVLLGAARALQARVAELRLDAVEGRQAWDVLDDIAAKHAAGTLLPVVVIDVGNNGVISPSQLTHTLQLLADRQQVVVLNDRVPRDWETPNNHTLATVSRHFANVRLIDWHGISGTHPNWFWEDGIHLDPTGASAYAQLIVSAARGTA